ncbi:MAG: DUF1697 domain-containing protein [Candidatus Nomurabacteria bacterium]|nr:MAG: DUF1697 domain-containing protein [Candidatus Nomurabacteria bacterium]
MRYIALLRGINVGGNNKVEMKRLKELCGSLGYTDVSTYINSGNILFNAKGKSKDIQSALTKALVNEFGFPIPVLIKTQAEVKKIVAAIPQTWQNDHQTQKTDVAFLFPEVDDKKTLDELPMKKEYMDLRYIKGAIVWHVKKENLNKSQLSKVIGSKLYKYMTVRNVNTARYLAAVDF